MIAMDGIEDVMQQDSAIDDMPDFGIMTGYVKMKVWKTYKEAVGARHALSHETGKELEQTLEEGAPQAMLPVLVKLNREGWFSNFVHELPQDESIVFVLWDKFTTDDMSHEDKIENARKIYKKKLRGCIGVQPSGIIRANVKDYRDESPENLPDYQVYRDDV